MRPKSTVSALVSPVCTCRRIALPIRYDPGAPTSRANLLLHRREQILIGQSLDERAQRPEDLLTNEYVLHTVLSHRLHRHGITSVHLHPEFPTFVLHLLCIREGLRNRIEPIIRHEEMALRLSTSVYVVKLWQWRKAMKDQTGLDELPIKALPIVRDYAVGVLQDFVQGGAEVPVIINIGGPAREVPRIYAMNLVTTQDLPAGTNNRTHTQGNSGIIGKGGPQAQSAG